MMFTVLKRGLALLLSAHLLFDPLIAYAGGVTPDASAPAANRPGLETAPNGVPMVNIVAPTGGGLSRNKFTDFNVGTGGLILNNSQSAGVSKLGGVVLGNPNLQSGTASLILAEVTGGNLSLLQGMTEVFGSSADVILANPNGVTCQGCGFINTPRATLSTGRPSFDASGAFTGLDVRQGAVLVDGAVLDVTGLDSFDIVSRTASLNAAIKAKSLGIYTGSGHFDYATRHLAGDGSSGTGVSIDSTALGGMYANRIVLVGTDKGVGVNLEGEAQAADSLVITADGGISAQRLRSDGAMSVASASARVAIGDTAYAGTTLSVSGAEVANAGTMAAAGDVAVAASGALVNDGQMAAGVSTDGTLTAGTGTLSITAGGIANNGQMQSGRATTVATPGTLSNASGATFASLGDVSATAAALDNQGTVAAGGGLAVNSSGTVSNGGRIGAGGDASLSAGGLDNAGTVSAGGALSVQATGDLANRAAGRIAAGGTMALTAGGSGAGTLLQSGWIAGGGAVTLSGPRVIADGGSTTTAATALALMAGGDLIIAAGGSLGGGQSISLGATGISTAGMVDTQDLSVSAVGAVVNQGSLTGRASLLLSAGSLENDGVISAGPSLAVTLAGGLANAGTLEATGDADLRAGPLVNTGTIAVDGGLTARLSSLSNAAGATLSAGATMGLDSGAGTMANGGTVVSGTGMTIAAGDLSNTAGAVFAAGGALSATLATLDNRGSLSANGALGLATTGIFSNQGSVIGAGAVDLTAGDLSNGGTIASGGGLTARLASLSNSGTVSGGAGLSVTLGGGLSNSGILVSGGDFTLAATDPLNSGTIAATGVLSLTLADLSNQGSITGGTGLSLVLTDGLINQGTVASGGDATIRASGLANAGIVSATGALDVGVTGDLANASGEMVAGTTVRLRAASLENAAVISGRTGLSLTVAGTLSNSGSVASGGDIALWAAGLSNGGAAGIAAAGSIGGTLSSLVNRAPLTAGGGLTLVGLASLDNYALMLADGAMRLEVSGAFGNWGGALVAGGGLSITGPGGVQAGSIANLGGSIETVAGDMTLSAAQVTNQASGDLQATNGVIYSLNATMTGSLGSCSLGPKDCDGQYWRNWVWVPNPVYGGAGAWYGSTNPIAVRSWIVESGSGYTGTAASIAAGGNLSISGGAIANVYSTISSTGNMDLSGGSLSNAGGQTVDTWYVSSSTSTMTRCFGGMCADFGNGGGTSALYSWVAGQQGGRIVAGGALTGSFTGQIDNVGIQQYAAVSGTGAAAAVSPALATAGGVGIGDVVHIQTGQIATTSALGHSGAIDLVTGAAADASALLRQSSFPATQAALTSALSQRLAGFSAKFGTAPGSSPYLYETRFQYTDLGTFYGSDYFFARMGVSTSSLPKRLGDAYMDQTLVSQAVIQQTGQKYLSSSYTSDAQQMQALLDNAVAESSALHLNVGQSLSATQIASLTSDIVWYVDEVVDGQTVLVPTLYLADSSKINAAGATIASGGATTLTAASVSNQGGTLSAADKLVVSASGSISDVSGLLKSGGDMTLAAGGGVTVATQTATLTGAAGVDRTVRVGEAEVRSGGTLSISAGSDLTVTGADVAAKGGVTLAAGNDVTVATNTLSHDEQYSDAHSHSELHDVDHDASTISAGQGLTLQAGRDVAVSGGTLAAGSDVRVTAGGSIGLAAVTDSHYEESNTSKSGGLMNSSKSRTESQTVSNRGTTVDAGGTVSLTAGTDLTLRAAQVTAGSDIDLTAGGTLSLLSATDSSYLSSTSSKSSAAWQSSVDKGHSDTTVVMTGLQAGGTLNVSASKIVADYKSTGDLRTSLAALAADPKTAWVATLATKDPVVWQAVQEAHKQWDHESQGLSAAASAIIAIVVAAVTAGAGLAAAVAEEAATAGLVTAGSDAALAMGAAGAAGFSTLVTQATTALINNQGDLGKTLQQLGPLDTVKNLAISMASAGALSEVGSATDFHGITMDKALDNPLNYAENVAGHAAVGCAMGAASGGSCEAGAASGAVSAAATPAYGSAGLTAGTAISAAIGGATSAITGGEVGQGAVTGAFGYLFNNALVMEDPNAVAGAGHMAVAIGDDKSGWNYYSKDGYPYITDGNQFLHYDTEKDLLGAQSRYTSLLLITTTKTQDLLMDYYASGNFNTSYSICSNNCSDLVVGTLRAGGIAIPANITMFGVTTPSKVFNGLKN